MANNGAWEFTLPTDMHGQQQLPCHAATDTDGALTHESTSTETGGSCAGKMGPLKPPPKKHASPKMTLTFFPKMPLHKKYRHCKSSFPPFC